MKINHIGYLVKNIEKAIKQHEALGFHINGETIYDEARNVKLAFLSNDGCVIELVEPGSETSVAWNLLKRKGTGPYHICYETGNINETEKKLISDGYIIIDPPRPAPAFHGRKVAFYINREIGIIELLETGECDEK